MHLRFSDLRRTLALLGALVVLGLAVVSSAQAQTVAIPGNPLTVYVNDAGRITARQAGDTSNVFYSPGSNDSPNAGFNLGFPDGLGSSSGPITFGPAGSSDFEPVSQGTLQGAGTPGSPYSVTTLYRAPVDSSLGVNVTQVVTYVNGARRFGITYTVQNGAASPVRFRAGEYADLYMSDDSGTGFLDPGPPRWVGGRNVSTGRAGGIEEVASSPWDRFQTGSYSLVGSNLDNLDGPGLANTVDPADVDNGVAVQWDDFFASPLGPGATATFNTAWKFSQFAPPPPPPPPVDNSVDAQLARLPAPRLGRTVNVGEVKGAVYVRLARASGARASQAKGRGFIRLSQARQIPVGSLLDTRKGTVRLVSATTGGRRQQGDFLAGLFTTLQSRRGRGMTELRMRGGKFTGCTSRRRRGRKAETSARRSKRRIRRLRGNARGRFRTRGRYSSATVRGTDWTVTDRCDGTLTKVRRGSVVVRDLRRKKKLILRAGRSKLVRAPGR